MTKEDFQNLEVKVDELKKAADIAAEALANDPTDTSLQQKADAAEGALADAEAELGSAVVEDEEPQGEPSEDDEHIDFDEELKKIEGRSPETPVTTPPQAPANPELEKAQKALFHNANRLKALGGDPSAVIAALTPAEPVVPPATPPAPTPTPVVPSDNITRDDVVEMEFGRRAKSEAERKVYMHHYKNSIVRTGNLAEDMENAMLIANKGKILRSFSEIKRSNETVPKPPSGSGSPTQAPRVPKISSADATVLRRRGFKQQADGSWKGKRYTISVDPKTGKMVETQNPKV